MTRVKDITDLLLSEQAHVNKQGNRVHSMFMPSERYAVDFAEDFVIEGWEQYDTDQDAPYFGCWVNCTKWLVLTYAEGDWSLTISDSREGYNAEIEAMNGFYGEGFIAKAINMEGQLTVLRQDREAFLVSDGVTKEAPKGE